MILRYVKSGKKCCGEQRRYICTRPKNHKGYHAAHITNDTIVEIWNGRKVLFASTGYEQNLTVGSKLKI